MSQPDEGDMIAYLEGGRRLLTMASETYERSLSPLEYWWMGVGLAAITLSEMSGRGYATGRLEQLIDRLGYKGMRGDWLQRFVEELAEMNAEGLLWPLYQRSADGPVESTGLQISDTFDGEAAYFLTLGHIGVALSLNREAPERVEPLAEAISDLVEGGRTPAREAAILDGLRSIGQQG